MYLDRIEVEVKKHDRQFSIQAAGHVTNHTCNRLHTCISHQPYLLLLIHQNEINDQATSETNPSNNPPAPSSIPPHSRTAAYSAHSDDSSTAQTSSCDRAHATVPLIPPGIVCCRGRGRRWLLPRGRGIWRKRGSEGLRAWKVWSWFFICRH